MGEFCLSKSDRLHSKKLIGELFEQGESFFVFPLKVVFLKASFDDGKAVKAAFSVSKRNFKRAVKRNYLKRLMREAYRLNRPALSSFLDERGEQLSVMFIYAAKELRDYQTVEKGMLKALDKLKLMLGDPE
ncbi:ribonuclease P protein component [Mangrovibacterium marinum]|uniref:Ribonuclease P protein component n=1 Tax=Mangrovibacterium marinum TaxID=1639118 RepID=A0A2T5C2K1_9BACT|nr:ribonuclease P protein component [Mangrovibacterium marinum]PTN08983.1 ribonuclease P protein component [Mangrovibacterium marinum]